MATTLGVDFNPTAMALEVPQEANDIKGSVRKVAQVASASESVPLDAVVSRDQRPELQELRQVHVAVSNYDRADHLTNTIGELLAQIEAFSEQMVSGEAGLQDLAEIQAQIDVAMEGAGVAKQALQHIEKPTSSREALVAQSEAVSPINIGGDKATPRIAGAGEAVEVATEVVQKVKAEAAVFARAQTAGLQENAISLVG